MFLVYLKRILLLGKMFYKLQLRLCLLMWFRSAISMLTLCQVDLSINERRVLKSQTQVIDLSASPFNSVTFCFLYFKALLLRTYAFRIVMSSWIMDSYLTETPPFIFVNLVLKYTFLQHKYSCTISLCLLFTW